MKTKQTIALTLFALAGLVVLPGQAPVPELKRIESEDWGKTADGTVVQRFTLRNAHGMVARIMTYGATITELDVPDRKGVVANVVLGADTWDRYLRGFGTPASIMGRVANRIGGAAFTLEGVDYKLAANAGANTIHGGRKGFGVMVWQGKAVDAGPNAAAVRTTYLSKDGEENFPGNLTAQVTYTLTDNNELRLDYEATTDKTTIVNLTSHAYFNLAGTGVANCLDHEIWIDADRYTVADAQLLPTGEIAPVKGTPLDFTTAATIGSRIDALKPKMSTYDHNFVLNNGGKSVALAGRATEPKSGRVMEVRTDQPGMQLYTGNAPHAAFCFETQHFPDSVHHADFPTTTLKAGDTFKSTTIFTFSTKP